MRGPLDSSREYKSALVTARGTEAPEEIVETVEGNSRLLVALRSVNSMAVPWELASRLGALLR
jgi:hypothetical protein